MNHFLGTKTQGTEVLQLEMKVRTFIFKHANILVGDLLQQAADEVDASYQLKPGERRMNRVGIDLQGMFGISRVERTYIYHPGKKQGHYPADAALGLEGSYTPALARIICLEATDSMGFEKAEHHLAETGGMQVPAREIHRLVQRVGGAAQEWQEREALQPLPDTKGVPILYISADGTGIPMRKEALKGRKGKQADGSAKTQQSYLGCIYEQHTVDEKGHPVRDHESTTYVSSMGKIDEFAPCLRQEAIRRGLALATTVILLIDGASGLARMGRTCFPTAIQIVDFYHAIVHGGKVLEALLGSKEHPDYKRRLHQWARRLLKDKVEELIKEIRKECAGKRQKAAVEKELGYFIKNVDRMQYGTFRKRGYFIGSGVVEAGCKTVIGGRCKQSGMFWGEPGAEKILAFRCIHASRRTNEFWKARLDAHASRNDPLRLAA